MVSHLKMKIFLFTLGTILALILPPANALAADDSTDTKSKNVGVALLLGLDPLPADSLFYAGNKTSGYINLGVGGLGAGILAGSIIGAQTCDSDEGFDCLFWTIPASIGGGIYVSTLIWDAIGGVASTKRHNERLQKSPRTGISLIGPSVAYVENSFYGIIGGRF